MNPLRVGLCKLCGGRYAEAFECGRKLAADPPNVGDIGAFKGTGDVTRTGQGKDAVRFGRFFGNTPGDFGHRLGCRRADRNGYAGPLQNSLANITAKGGNVLPPTVNLQKGLIDRVDFNRRAEGRQRLHHTGGHVGIQGIVGRQNGDIVLFEKGVGLETGHSHCDTEGLGFVASSDNAAVVVGQNNHRPTAQHWRKDPLARDIKVIAVDQYKQ